MQSLLRAGLWAVLGGALLLLAVLASAVSLAQEPATVGVDVDRSGDAGAAVGYVTNAGDLDAFELELRFDPQEVQVIEVAPGEGWTLVPRSVEVQSEGVIRAAGFAVDSPCPATERCVLLEIALVGLTGDDWDGLGVIEAVLQAAAEPIDFEIANPAAPPGEPATDNPGAPAVPVAQQSDEDDGVSFGVVMLWLVGLASGVVAVAAVIVAGSRWLWNRGRPVAEPEATEAIPPTVSDYLDRMAELGSIEGGSQSSPRADDLK